jgi:Holliday junction resolvase RusA-like endonuclease
VSIPMMPPQASPIPFRGVAFIVRGTPAPQGSKHAYVVGNRARVVEDSKMSAPWRDSVAAAAADAMNGASPIDAPVTVTITFFFARPQSVKRPLPSVRPDIDKLARAVLDGLTAGGVYTDDSRVVDLHAKKRYRDVPGAEITVTAAEVAS